MGTLLIGSTLHKLSNIMRIYWNDNTHTKVNEQNISNCEAFGHNGFHATTTDGVSIVCFYANIKFIEMK